MNKLHLAVMGLLLLSLCSFGFWAANDAPPVDKALYQRYLEQFKPVTLPLVVDAQYLNGKRQKSRKELNGDFSSFIPSLARGYMSRMGPDDFHADALIARNKTFNAVLYVQSPSYGDNQSLVLSTIDHDGNLIAQENIAYHYDDQSYQTAIVQADLSIATKSFNDSETETALVKINPDGSISRNGKPTGKVVDPAIDYIQNLDNKLDMF